MNKFTKVFCNDDIIIEVDSNNNYRISFLYNDGKERVERLFSKTLDGKFIEITANKTFDSDENVDKVFDFYRKNKPTPNKAENNKDYDNEDFYDELDKEVDKAFKRKRNNTTTTGAPSTADPILEGWLKSFGSVESYVPKCCQRCPNHPSNGGSGICNCTAPLFDPENPYRITC